MPTRRKTVTTPAKPSLDTPSEQAEHQCVRHAPQDIDAAWEEEIRKRIEQIDAGQAEFIPWEAVIANLRERLHRGG